MAFCKNCGKELKKGEKCSCEKEVKFCKNCGKKLIGSEVCGCEKSTSTTNFDFVETMKEIKADLLTSLKKPVTFTEENTDTKNMPKTYVLLILLSLTFGIFIASLCKTLFATIISSLSGGFSLLSVSNINIPYIKIIIFGSIIFAIAMAVYSLIILLIPSLFKNKKLSYTEALTFTTSAHMPMMWANVICAILGFLGVSAGIVLILYLIANMIVTYNFMYSYKKYTNINDNKFGYAIAVLVILSSILIGICTYAVSSSITKSITHNMVDKNDFHHLLDY